MVKEAAMGQISWYGRSQSASEAVIASTAIKRCVGPGEAPLLVGAESLENVVMPIRILTSRVCCAKHGHASSTSCRGECVVCQLGAVSQPELPELVASGPDLSDTAVSDFGAMNEIHLEQRRAILGQCNQSLVIHSFASAKLDPPEQFAAFR